MKLNFKKQLLLLLVVAALLPMCSFAQKGTATFEDLKLEKESFWYGLDQTAGFQSGSYMFDNFCAENGSYWGGFAYSNITETDFQGYDKPSHYGNAVGCGHNGSANFAVVNCFAPATLHVLDNVAEGEQIRGFYVTNSATALKSMTVGDVYSHKFAKGDWLMLTITEPNTGKKVEYYLADCRSDNEADHYVLDTWQWVDLRELGNVKSLSFVITGSDTGDFGLNTPAYFCMDDFNGERKISNVPVCYVNNGDVINVEKYFSFDDKKASVEYSIDEIPENCGYTLSLNGSDLEVTGDSENTVIVKIKAVSKGVIKYIALPLMKESKESQTATFENLKLEEESYWNGADMSGAFVSSNFKFNNSYMADYASWSGFAYSDITSTEFLGYNDPTHYANAVGCGYDGSSNFAVANASSWWPATLDVVGEGQNVSGFYITNSSNAVKAMTEGLAPARAFAQGDWLMLTITETNTDKKVEYYLADYRSENEADHYMLDTWQWVDLRELGNIKNLKFVVSGSDSGDFGLNTPAYFCMDNFNGERVITEVPAQTLESASSIELGQFFTFDNNDASVVYSIDEVSENCAYELSINGSNLEVSGNAAGDFSVVIKAVKKGKIYFVNIPVTVGTGIEAAEAADNTVTDIYTVDGKRVNSKVNGVNIIRTNGGKVKKVMVK